jgi:hypothetical protein
MVGLLAAATIPTWLTTPVSAIHSFGRGYDGPVTLGAETPVFSHQIQDRGRRGVMSHFWTTGSSEEAQAAMGVQLMINYRFDGELIPSISFNPASMAGQFFGAVRLPADAPWSDGTRSATQNTSMFAAGDKMGKNALISAWYNYYKLPFTRTVEVTASLAARAGMMPKTGTRVQLYCIVRGHEISAETPPLVLPSGLPLPPGVRMVLQKTDVVAKPNAFVPLANFSKGQQGLIFKLGLGLTATPPWGTRAANNALHTTNNYVEGCWHLLRRWNETLPGQVLGTGLEDFFDSAYGFSIVAPGYVPATGPASPSRLYPGKGVNPVEGLPYQHPSSGILHFSSDYESPSNDSSPGTGRGVERFSAYRFFDAEYVGFSDGGGFGWDNGCEGYSTWPSINKCGERPLPPPPPPPFPPPGPPASVGCADGTCEALCHNPAVRGCGVSWDGAKSIRTAPSRNCSTSGSTSRPHCGVPADACAAGWVPCLSGHSGATRTQLMGALTADACGGVWGAWATAMSHAPLDPTNATDRQFCPINGTGDNGCRGPDRSVWGAEPLCCGRECETPTCLTALWRDTDGCVPAGASSASCGTGMVRAGSGVCSAMLATNVQGVLCCKASRATGSHGAAAASTATRMPSTTPTRAAPGVRRRVAAEACLTHPTRVQAYVWAYVWPSDV